MSDVWSRFDVSRAVNRAANTPTVRDTGDRTSPPESGSPRGKPGWVSDTVKDGAAPRLLNREPFVVWFTGLSGAGKSTIAALLARTLNTLPLHVFVLDGDELRKGLNQDLGYSEADRAENVRRVGEVARLMNDAGLIVLVALISPSEQDRGAARNAIGAGRFVEVYVSTPLEVAEARDVKGLYQRARRGEIGHFTGVTAAYEAPTAPDVVVDASGLAPDECVDAVLRCLYARNLLRRSGTSRATSRVVSRT
jgi:bifunctional enzyme CysN/CysC